jgi:cell fate (sporulation/competence/biofilm development) regulator YmcA (YheA/YmcA/DUF963 family)
VSSLCETYIQDAEQSGDRELTEFFQQVKEQSCQQAEQAKQLMTQRMSQQQAVNLQKVSKHNNKRNH